ncbi:unnamed protein product [Bursaphelenchus xylophilus]|uniref:(pine wood nematode) hypothetical protein n=1 Tax=Bursaphelenchus xylophilus TaxID=6326 RepID=A0A1I7RRQ3_BURXY|nr:unnamed protein product [Bursaphelenchus xylophilus]CAG9123556.1 unnamed protein product [Bursaphelenchus xylophilus]
MSRALLALLLPFVIRSENNNGDYIKVFTFLKPLTPLERSNDLSLLLQRENYRDEAERLHKLFADFNVSSYDKKVRNRVEEMIIAKYPHCAETFQQKTEEIPVIKGLDADFLDSNPTIYINRSIINALSIQEPKNIEEKTLYERFRNIVSDKTERERVIELDTTEDLNYFVGIGQQLLYGLAGKEKLEHVKYYSVLYLLKRQVLDLNLIDDIYKLDESDNSRLDFILGQVYMFTNNNKKGLEYIRKVIQKKGSTAPLLYMASFYSLKFKTAEYNDYIKQALEVDPELKNNFQFKKNVQFYNCRELLYDSLTKENEKLMKKLDELNRYHSAFERELKLHNLISSYDIDPIDHFQSILEFFYTKFGYLPGLKCIESSNEKGRARIKCTLIDIEEFDKVSTLKLKELEDQRQDGDRRVMDAYHKKRTLEAKINNQNKIEFMENVKAYQGLTLEEPPLPVLYLREQNPPFTAPNTQDFCTKEFGRQSATSFDFGHFISIESRGYSVNDLLNKYLGITPDDLLPFPWAEPNCDPVNVNILNNITLLQNINTIKELWDSPNLFPSDIERSYFMDKLEDLMGSRSDGSFLLADFGNRIYLLKELKIGPKWVQNELAILYFRALGRFRNALECIVENLSGDEIEDIPNSDMTLVQLVSIIRESGIENATDDINLLLKAALLNSKFEHPLTYYLMGDNCNDVDKRVDFLLRSYKLDPTFKPLQKQLYYQFCRNVRGKGIPVENFFQPICCWSTEHNIYCFGDPNNEKSCFKINVDDNTTDVSLSSFRCSGTYTARSFLPPARILFFIGFIHPISKLRNKKVENKINSIMREKTVKGRQKKVDTDAFPLDYGGYSEERINKFRGKVTLNTDNLVHKYINPAFKRTSEATEKAKVLESIDSVSWGEILKYDMSPPKPLPSPEVYLKTKGKKLYKSLALSPLDSCPPSLDSKLLAPYSTDMLITAKGVDLKAFVELQATSVNDSLEPYCPLTSATSIALFDNLAAFKYQGKFKFYKPEKALKEPFLSIAKEKDTVESLATKLTLAMKSRNNKDQLWKLSTIAALYWRLQGDAVNAVNCLSYALKYAPKQYRDVAASGLANIYHQAGFLHSALYAADFALKNSETNEVSVHLTIANIYASLRYYDHALQFYYSTLALQSNFILAKERIRAIECIRKRDV